MKCCRHYSLEFVKLAYQLAQEWDKTVQDYRAGKTSMTTQRDTFFYLSGIIERIRELTKKCAEIIEAERRSRELIETLKNSKRSIIDMDELKTAVGKRKDFLMKILKEEKEFFKRSADELEKYYQKFKKELGDRYWKEYKKIERGDIQLIKFLSLIQEIPSNTPNN